MRIIIKIIVVIVACQCIFRSLYSWIQLVVAKRRTNIRLNIPVHELERPAILDLQKPLTKQHVRKFPISLYEVRAGDQKLTPRFAACPAIYASEHIRLKATRTAKDGALDARNTATQLASGRYCLSARD